jgi:hypothetical protein
MAFHSWSVPGKKPGTSSNTSNGILKLSQKRTKRAALVDELISSTPAKNAGWLATIPMLRPAKARKTNHNIFGKIFMDF